MRNSIILNIEVRPDDSITAMGADSAWGPRCAPDMWRVSVEILGTRSEVAEIVEEVKRLANGEP